MIVLYIVMAVALGLAIGFLIASRKTSAEKEEQVKLRIELEKGNTRNELLRQQIEQQKDNHQREMDLLRQQAEHEAQLRSEQYAEQLRTAQEQITNVARQVMEQNSDRLKERNIESLGQITQPLKDAISEMRKDIGESIKNTAWYASSFREQVQQMMKSNHEIGEKAQGLANVLRRDNKVAGNMGEIILGDLLASQGLTEGIHYEVQARLRDETGRAVKNDETGKEMQPDVILHYPQGQDAIIDSKVSLVAYERYVNATDDEQRRQALQDHIRSVRQHVNELARKDYSRYVKPPRKAVDFVIMFVPFESSLQLALANDPTLWRDAFERKVFISGEQNLLGILHIIHIAWVQNQQAENQQKVFGLAEQLVDRLGDFAKRYQDLGEAIERVRKAYDYADKKLLNGQQSVMRKGRELIDLGTKENPNRRLPNVMEDVGVDTL